MNFATIAIITIITTIFLYLIFLVLGLGGIAKNRRAQGLNISQKMIIKLFKTLEVVFLFVNQSS